jgi:hypothetical protein
MSATKTAGSTGPTPHVVAATADSVSWVKLVEVSGDGGVLTGLGVAGGPDYHYLKVEIDGVLVVDEFLAGTGVPGHVNNGVGMALPFKHDLIVHARDEPVPSALAKYWVAYVTDHSDPVEDTPYVEGIEGKDYRYRRQLYRKPDGNQYSVESLVGPSRVAGIRLARDWVNLEDISTEEGGRVWIGAEISLSDIEAKGGEPPEATAIVRLAGRQAPVDEVRPTGIEEPLEIWMPGPGEYAIATTLDGYSNVPTFFTVL